MVSGNIFLKAILCFLDYIVFIQEIDKPFVDYFFENFGKTR